MTWTACYDALELHAMGMDLDVDWAFPNVQFDPQDGRAYIQVSLLPTSSGSAWGKDGRQRLRGIFQLLLAVPACSGPQNVLMRVDQIAKHFRRRELTAVGVAISTYDPTPGPTYIDGTRAKCAISIPFETR